jgi:hypothetical protein
VSTAYQDYVGGCEVHNDEHNNHLGYSLKSNASSYHFLEVEVELPGALKIFLSGIDLQPYRAVLVCHKREASLLVERIERWD